MPELRKDYILDRYVIIAAERGKRPHEVDSAKASAGKTCYFCPGNESMTPPEIMRKGDWQIRVFDNKFPAVKLEGKPGLDTHNDFYTFADAVGKHEVVVETPEHDKQLWDLSEKQIAQVIEVYVERFKEISQLPGIKYVSVFKNNGAEAGCSIAHSHSQIIAYNILPTIIKQKVRAASKYEFCPYCEIMIREEDSDRRIYSDDDVVSFTPYASRFAYEAWIFPRKHITGMDQLEAKDIKGIARALHRVLAKLKTLNAPYNFFFHYDEDLHLHLQVLPRFSTVKWAGFELSTETIINPVSPEIAAEFYRA